MRYLTEIGLFLITALIAYVEGWSPRELLWGLWLSSLLVGYSLILYGIFCSTFFPTGKNPEHIILRMMSIFLFVPFFTVHFGGFHAGHGAFIHTMFPLYVFDDSMDLVDQIYPFAKTLLQATWPIVVASAIASRQAFREARHGFNPMTPYIKVVKMHLMIFILAPMIIMEWDSRWIVMAVLLMYFFPWKSLWHYFRSRKAITTVR